MLAVVTNRLCISLRAQALKWMEFVAPPIKLLSLIVDDTTNSIGSGV